MEPEADRSESTTASNPSRTDDRYRPERVPSPLDADGSRGGSDGDGALVVQRRYDPDRGPELATAVVSAVADAEGTSPMEMSPPLYECVDVAAVERAFFGAAADGDTRRVDGTVAFPYADYRVEVDSDGLIRVFSATGHGLP